MQRCAARSLGGIDRDRLTFTSDRLTFSQKWNTIQKRKSNSQKGNPVKLKQKRGKKGAKHFSMADITDEDVLILAGKETNKMHRIRLDYLQVTSGLGIRNVAIVGLDIAGEKFEASATGNGPVDAAIKAVKQIIHRQTTIQEFLIQAINKGSDDTGKVHMQVEHEGINYYGFSANTDIVAAAVEAFINAINKFVK
ncbi:MAG: hypothetical protein BGN96_03525 [Bacteroidales bacterium 45-6]|nr:MAG: hypothetical protein BGN96_03525 [Bacteroidales bacterium 45-6]